MVLFVGAIPVICVCCPSLDVPEAVFVLHEGKEIWFKSPNDPHEYIHTQFIPISHAGLIAGNFSENWTIYNVNSALSLSVAVSALHQCVLAV